MYTKDDLTFGFELELSNVPKSFVIPTKLGKWEYCEADIVNTQGEYKNVCADPLGINPPVGGEINTFPTKTKEDQVDRIFDILDAFEDAGHNPDVGMTSHSHIHVHVKGLENDIDALKRLVHYVQINQEFTFKSVYGYRPEIIPETGFNKIRNYLKNDGARKMPEWMANNIIREANNFEDVLTLFARGKDGVTKVRPIRYGINLYSLKNCRTIEFRCFRGSLNIARLDDCFEFVESFILEAINGGVNTDEIIDSKDWHFPEMQFNAGQAQGWIDTKHHVELVKNKNRKYWEAD